MSLEDILVFVVLLVFVLGLGGWRLGVIHIDKRGIDYFTHKTNENTEYVNSGAQKSVVSKGDYIISVTNPEVGMTYSTSDPATGIVVTVSISTPEKFVISVMGTRNDVHTTVIQLPPGCQYYFEEYLIDSVSIKGSHWGLTVNTNVDLKVLYRTIGKDNVLIVTIKPGII